MQIRSFINFFKSKTIIILLLGAILFSVNIKSALAEKKDAKIKKYINYEYFYLINLVKEKRINEASAQAFQLLNNYPDKSGIICSLVGDLYLALNEKSRAEYFYLKAIELDKNDINYYVTLINFYKHEGGINSAVEILKKGYKISPLNPKILNEFGEYYSNIGFFYEAIKYWNRCYDLSCDSSYLLKVSIAYKAIENKNFAITLKNLLYKKNYDSRLVIMQKIENYKIHPATMSEFYFRLYQESKS